MEVTGCPSRQVGKGVYFVVINTKNKKISLQGKYEYIKNTMAKWIAQKSYKALFPLWSRNKKDILKLIN